jgi:hypothetical protein
MSLWYIWRKPCTYSGSRLALSPNRLNQGSTSASSPRSAIGCIQTYQNKIPYDPHHLGVPPGAPKIVSEPMVRLAQTMHLLAPTLTLSQYGPKRDSSRATSPSSSMVRSPQTVHRSCVKINTISKQTEPSFHLSLLT